MPSTAPAASKLGSPRRWATFVGGVFILIVGISLTIVADIGVGSWQVLETGLVETTGASFAVVAVAESLLCLVIATFVLGQRPWIATVVLGCAGVGIGALLDVLETPASAVGQWAMFGGGILLLTMGLALYLASDLGASAQDALFVGVYERFRLRPSRVRFVMDASLVAAGALLGGQFGVGTVVITIAIPLLIDPALRIAHDLARTDPPEALRPVSPAV